VGEFEMGMGNGNYNILGVFEARTLFNLIFVIKKV
jgi:hypothetical protein